MNTGPISLLERLGSDDTLASRLVALSCGTSSAVTLIVDLAGWLALPAVLAGTGAGLIVAGVRRRGSGRAVR